jgi:type I pantothenate kinase
VSEPSTTSPFLNFSRAQWAELRAATPLTLTEGDLAELRGINEAVDINEVVDIYLPLSRLLNLHVRAAQQQFTVVDAFLGAPGMRLPYVIAIAGSVAVGKSTTARILQALLWRWPDHPSVDLVTTDGFLFPNRVLQSKGILHRKGFPESYDRRRLLEFVMALKTGVERVVAPTYSHLIYDILVGEERVVARPDIVILEGLNVLQGGGTGTYISDYFDFSIYVDAEPSDVERWYVDRFLTLRDTAFRDPHSYFHNYADLSDEEAVEMARSIWKEINQVNLFENILPTRERATLILEKGPDHALTGVRLRRR